MVYLEAINLIANALIGLLNVIGATQKVSDMIAVRIASGREDWTDAERDELTHELESAKQKADKQITKAGG